MQYVRCRDGRISTGPPPYPATERNRRPTSSVKTFPDPTADRLKTEGNALRSETVALDLSIAYLAKIPESPAGGSTGSSAIQTYSSAREAAEALLPQILP